MISPAMMQRSRLEGRRPAQLNCSVGNTHFTGRQQIASRHEIQRIVYHWFLSHICVKCSSMVVQPALLTAK